MDRWRQTKTLQGFNALFFRYRNHMNPSLSRLEPQRVFSRLSIFQFTPICFSFKYLYPKGSFLCEGSGFVQALLFISLSSGHVSQNSRPEFITLTHGSPSNYKRQIKSACFSLGILLRIAGEKKTGQTHFLELENLKKIFYLILKKLAKTDSTLDHLMTGHYKT